MKLKTNFIFFTIKKNILPTIFCIFTLCLIIFSKSNLSAVKSGLSLWATNVIPSLFPFFIATELLGHTNIIFKVNTLLNKIMRPIFNVPGCGAYALFMGIISGYPIGAKIASSFRENNLCTKEEAERLIAFTNNSGPLFILGTVGISLFGNTLIGFLLLITHFLSSITVGLIFKFWKRNLKNNISYNNFRTINNINGVYNYKMNNVSFSNLGEILSKSIMSAINSIVMIGGFIVLFSVILSIIKPIFNIFNSDFCTAFLSGTLELTNGLQLLANINCRYISINIILSSFLLGFGGISILLQVLSITSKTDISIKPYIYGKLLQGLFAAIYTFSFIYLFPIFNLNI